MKYSFILLTVFTCMLFVSCSKKNPAKTISENSVVKNTREEPQLVLTYVIDEFKLHRPKHNCERGFWFCVEGHWETKTVYTTNMLVSYTDPSGQSHLWASVEGKIAKIHFPESLKYNPLFTSDDLAFLNADSPYELSKGIIVKPGTYAVTTLNKELIVTVDLL